MSFSSNPEDSRKRARERLDFLVAVGLRCVFALVSLPALLLMSFDLEAQTAQSQYEIPLTVLKRAKGLSAAGESEAAKAVAEELFEVARSNYDLGDDSPINLYLLGDSAALAGRNYLALRYLTLAMEADPSYLDARLALAEALNKTGKPDDAVAVLEAGQVFSSSEPRLDYALAVSLGRVGRIEEGIAILQVLVQADPDNRALSSKLIELYLKAGKAAEAEALFEPLVAAGEVSWGDAYLVIVDSLLRSEDLNSARDYLRQAQSAGAPRAGLDRQFTRLYDLQGNRAREDGRLSRAVLYWNRALERSPDSMDLRVKVGSALVEMGSFEKAYSILEALLESVPSDPAYYTNLAKALRGKGEPKRAYQILKGASEIMRRKGNLEAAELFEKTLVEFAREDSELAEKIAPLGAE